VATKELAFVTKGWLILLFSSQYWLQPTGMVKFAEISHSLTMSRLSLGRDLIFLTQTDLATH